MSLSTNVLLVLALYVLQLFLQETSRFKFHVGAIVGNRDSLPQASLIASRLDRAKDNLREALPLFLGLSLLAIVNGADTVISTRAATVFLVARIAYVPAYVSGLPWIRSIIWLVSMGALATIAHQLVVAHGAA